MNKSRGASSGSRSLTDLRRDEVQSAVDNCTALHHASTELRRERYDSLVAGYYDLATDFYEFGWGDCFHFAPRRRGESLRASLLRHQNFLADRLSLKPGMRVLDVGCGVGGPMGNLARRTGASFVGININAYQLKRARANTSDVESLCSFLHADFMNIPEKNDHYDAVFTIEAICHAPDRVAAFRECFRVLRPGACFGGYEWCVTESFDPGSEEHLRIRKDIQTGAGLPSLTRTSDVDAALRDTGFEILETRDLAPESDPGMPWYRALQGRDLSLRSIPRTPMGRVLTNLTLRVAEFTGIVAPGTRAVSTLLNAGADALVAGGESGIVTPLYFFLARKPGNAGK